MEEKKNNPKREADEALPVQELPADIPPQLSLFEAPPPPDFLLSPAAGHRTLPGREEVAACQTGEI